MRRRDFIRVAGGAVAALPFPARAQQSSIVGLLSGVHLDNQQIAAVPKGLEEVGYVEGRNLAIKYRSAGGRFDRLPALFAELLHEGAGVVVAITPAAALAARSATATIPVVFATGADPIELGLVSSLNRPGGNITGITFLVNTLIPKRLELLQELVPAAGNVGLLINPKNPTSRSQMADAQAAATTLGLRLQVVDASSETDLEIAYTSFIRQRVDAIIVGADALFDSQRHQIVELSARYAMPAIYHLPAFVTEGGLISYGTSITDAFRLAGGYAGRILKGESPAELPVQQSTKIELVLNLKTARALGLTLPPTLLARANEVIE
jgi:putative ABC transport system substrate-binding protein